MQDRLRAEIECTSKHRTLGQVEWSRQLTREVAPFFVPVPTAQSRVQLGNGSDKPRRHQGTADMERSAPKPVETRMDTRDYTPTLHEELHPRCGVDIGRAPKRRNVFDEPQHQSDAVIEVELHPGWGRGKKSSMGKARRAPPTPRVDRADSPSFVYSAYTPVPDLPAFEAVESRLERPKGGAIPRCDERKLTPAPDHTPLEIVDDLVRRHTSAVDLTRSSRHFAGRSKLSEKYRNMFRTPPPPPLATPDRPRMTNGYATQRQSFNRSVESLLATADADRRRAKKLMSTNFGSLSRSSVRTAMLYTPSPSASPAATMMNGAYTAPDDSGATSAGSPSLAAASRTPAGHGIPPRPSSLAGTLRRGNATPGG
jgi:hypothetical protein